MGRLFQREKECAVSFGVGRECGVSKQLGEDPNGDTDLSAECGGTEARKLSQVHTTQGLGCPGKNVDFTQSNVKPLREVRGGRG